MNKNDLENTEWYAELHTAVEAELAELTGQDSGKPGRLEKELDTIQERKAGWNKSLGDPHLPAPLRGEIHREYEWALAREDEIERELSALSNRNSYMASILNPEAILDRVNRLDEVLGGDNATLANLELSLHIDSIECFDDGRVTMKVCRLGTLADGLELFQSHDTEPRYEEGTSSPQSRISKVKPRRRARLRVDTLGDSGETLDAAANFAADPHRFAGLDAKWFENYEFHIPTEKHWYQLNAKAVAQRRMKRLTHEKLADEFGVTVPTIRDSLTYAAENYPEFANLPKKIARSRWHETHAWEVAAKKEAEELGTNDLVKFFGKSDTTIRKALEFAENNPPPAPDEQSE